MARSLTLVGALGYRNLRDHSVAFEVLERLSEADLGPDVVLEDVSYNPIAVVQWLQAQPPDQQFQRVIVVSSIERAGRTPGAVSTYEWDRVVPSDALVQQAVTEAVTGIISLDNALVIAGYFGVLPASVTIVEIEPLEHEFGDQLSAEVARAMKSVVTLVRDMVHERSLGA